MTEKGMGACSEDLPAELWIQIFSYLEAHDLIGAFSNLNRYFDRLISSDYVPLYVCLGKTDRNPREYTIQPYWPDSLLHRIVSIRPAVPHQFSHIPEFIRWHSIKLIHLKSLTVKVRGREIPHLCDALKHFYSLTDLSLECVPNQILLDGILATPALRTCCLTFSPPVTPIITTSEHISPVEFLDIQLQDDSRASISHLLLSHMPKLKKLNMINDDIYVKNQEWIFFQAFTPLLELKTMALRCSCNYSTPVIFENLHHNFPALRHFRLSIKFDFLDQNLLTNILDHWWPLLQQIEQLHLTFQCRKYFFRATDHPLSEFDHFYSRIIAMNEQYDGLVQASWMEELSVIYQSIDISINKYS